MKPAEDAFGLRLAAKAADREKAARQEWPAFAERLTKLGYTSRAIAHAFSTLSGAGTVTDALEVLNCMSRSESAPVALIRANLPVECARRSRT
jgi:C4-dicarboxylate-specific signal transduction histidine kinase